MALTFPKVPFPGPIPANPTLTYMGQTYTFDAGLLTQRVGNWLADTVTDRWRLYDYEHGHVITDQEAALLGVAPEAIIVTAGISEIANNDAYVADTIRKNLGSALVAIAYQQLLPASAVLSAAETQLASDQAALTTATAKLAADQAANPQVPATIADDEANIASLTSNVNAADPAAITAAQNQVATIQAQIAAIETQFA